MKIITVFCLLAGLITCCDCGGGSKTTPPPPPSLSSITVAPSTSTVWVGLNPQQFTATGRYTDGTSQDLTASVSWSSSSYSIATITAGGLASAVGQGSATISASKSGVSGSSSLNVIGLAAAYVTPSGPALSLAGSPSTAQLSATVTWTDGKTQSATTGVSWSSSDSTVAAVNASGFVTRGGNAGYATVTANWNNFSVSTAVSVTTQSMSNTDLTGTYIFLMNAIDTGGPVFYIGSFTADGSGAMSGQIFSGATPANFTGTYTVFPDGRGDMTLALPSPLSAMNLRFVLAHNGDDGRMILFDPAKNTTATGAFQKQSVATFDASILHGTYVFKFGGADASKQPQTIVGMLTADGAGSITSGIADWNANGTVNSGGGRDAPLALSGTYTVANDGHGAMTLTIGSTQLHFAMVVVNNGLFRLLSTDSGQRLLGQFELQQVPSGGFQSVNGSYTFLLDKGGRAGSFALGGNIFFGPPLGGWASLSTAANYHDLEIIGAASNMTSTARAALDLHFYDRVWNTYVDYSFAAYMVSPNRMYWIETDAISTMAGLAEGTGSGWLNGTYIYMGGALVVASGSEASALALLDASTVDQVNGAGTFDGIVDVSIPISTYPVVGRIVGSMVGSGSFQTDVNSIRVKWQANVAGQNFTFYINSGSQAAMFGQMPLGDNPDMDGWMTSQD